MGGGAGGADRRAAVAGGAARRAAGRRGSRDRGTGMTVKKMMAGLVLAGVAAVLVRTFPDVKRYLKIRSM
ncbi:hypothetical protein GCM10028775_80470 [Catellatospora paridis]